MHANVTMILLWLKKKKKKEKPHVFLTHRLDWCTVEPTEFKKKEQHHVGNTQMFWYNRCDNCPVGVHVGVTMQPISCGVQEGGKMTFMVQTSLASHSLTLALFDGHKCSPRLVTQQGS